MLYSHLFGKTVKKAPADATAASHKLLYQAGFIRESTAGRYFYLPLGQRVQMKIMNIIREEMDRANAQEMLTPVLHPLSLWKENNRHRSAGYELMTIKDRRDFQFALGGTAEEMFVDVVRKFRPSYKDFPFNLYQFSIKFRDELRARGGLLRVREFIMKDAYSFHIDANDFQKEYEKMKKTYTRIFDRLGLATVIVESDNGYIGGEYCHEFVVDAEIGESKYLTTADGSYAAHEDVAVFKKEPKNNEEKMKPLQKIPAKRGTTMEDGVKFHQLPLWQQIKDVLFVDEKDRFILALIRGDYEVNEVKLKHLTGALDLRHATDEEIRNKVKSEPGFLSPVGIKDRVQSEIILVGDQSLRTVVNAYGGANQLHQDFLNINIDRDYKPDLEGDIALAKNGYLSTTEKQLIAKRGIEVGNIFQLGYHYSKKMHDAFFVDRDGKTKPFYMGCYGIGVGRTLAAIVEKYHDGHGILWPRAIAPFQLHFIALNIDDPEIQRSSDYLYSYFMNHGLEILYDDRPGVSPGEKFGDADLIGLPYRLIVSKKTAGKIEYKERAAKTSQLKTPEEILKSIIR